MWMSDAFAEMMLGHLVCLVQGNAFILVEWAYLGRGKLRWPVLWAELLCMGQLGLSLATGMSFFNVQSVLLNVLYLFVTAQLFGGTFADKLTACLINGTMCLLVENTVNYTYSWFTGVRTGEAWQHTGCLIALCAANLIVGAAVAHSLYSWNQKCALQPLQALVMSFFPGVAVVLNIVLMVTGTQQPATRMTMLLTFGMSVAVLVHIAIVQMFNDQVVQRQNSRYRAQLEQQRAEQTAALVHDLKTPLAIITGNADLLAEDENLTEAQKAQIAAMQRAAEKADRYLQTLRAVNTAETSPQEPMQRVQVQEILTRCADDAKLLCNNKNIQFVLNNAMENARTIPAQRQALGRALDNILENAVRFTPAGGTITLDAVEEGQEIVFTVTDTGPGFSPEALQKAGRELFTTDAARGQHWGLGLAAARRTAQTHNGTLTVSNGENGGGKVELRVRS